jgi:adenylate kinase family enzyme
MNAALFGDRICLLGPHGAGKSSVGRALMAHGYEHINIGAVARLARRNLNPSNIPGRLRIVLARHVPGSPLDALAVSELLDHIRSRPRIVVDGFPASVEHLAVIGALDELSFVYAYTPRRVREARLIERAQTTARGWQPGGRSERDIALPALCWALRERGHLRFFNNTASPLKLEGQHGA